MSYTAEEIERFRKFGDETDNGVAFDWGYANINGAYFILLREPKHTDEDIAKAKAFLKRNRDVVSIRVEKMDP